jgi:DNA-binding CsgD family transcriptional regulator
MLYFKEIMIIALLGVIIFGNLLDFIVDYAHGASTLHLLEEVTIIIISIGMILWLLLGIRCQQRELEQLRRDMAASRQAGTRPSRTLMEARRQLGSAIQEQFRTWELTDSEREVGLLLLKGLSFKEIAALRATREKTVRAQASSLYRKAGVGGRHAFSAWFIEDIL